MANQYLTSALIAPEAVAILQSINSLIRLGNRKWEGMFIAKNYAPGDTINLRLDNYYNVQRGDVVVTEDIVEASIPLTIQPLFSVPILYTPTDLERDIVDFTQEFVEPAVRAISAQIDYAIYVAAQTQIAHATGDITAPLNTFLSLSSVNPIMDTLNMNNYGRNMVIDPYNFNSLLSSSDLRNSFLPTLNKAITLDAQLGRLAGFEVFKDSNFLPFISGTHTAGGNITVSVAVQTGSSIILTGLTPGATFVAGDTLNFTGVQEWNSVGQTPIQQIKQLVVTANGTADGTGTVTLATYPPLINTGPRQNFFTRGTSPNQIPAGTVVTSPTNTTVGYMNNIAFTDRGLALALPPLIKMDSPYSFVSTDPQSGISMRVSKDAQILNNKNVLRLDAQMGLTWVNDQAVKVLSGL